MKFIIIENETTKEIATLELEHFPRKDEKISINKDIYTIISVIHSEKGTILVVYLNDDSTGFLKY
jgi:hypothetical protein